MFFIIIIVFEIKLMAAYTYFFFCPSRKKALRFAGCVFMRFIRCRDRYSVCLFTCVKRLLFVVVVVDKLVYSISHTWKITICTYSKTSNPQFCLFVCSSEKQQNVTKYDEALMGGREGGIRSWKWWRRQSRRVFFFLNEIYYYYYYARDCSFLSFSFLTTNS